MLCMGFNPGATGWQAQTDLLSQGGRSFVFFLCISFYLSRLLNILPAGSALNSFRFLYDSSHPQVMYQNVCVCVREREREQLLSHPVLTLFHLAIITFVIRFFIHICLSIFLLVSIYFSLIFLSHSISTFILILSL